MRNADCSEKPANNEPCCKLESIVSIDERGQMVLPKEIRETVNIRAGEKLALVSWGQMNEVSCITLIKIEDLNKMVQELLKPILKETIK